MGPAAKTKPVDPVLAAIEAAPWDERSCTEAERSALAEAKANAEFVEGADVTAQIADRAKE